MTCHVCEAVWPMHIGRKQNDLNRLRGRMANAHMTRTE